MKKRHSDDGNSLMIGPYKVLDRIGQGGMGEVFLVYDSANQREIALKRMHPKNIGNAKRREQFIKEARLTGQLKHPVIISIYDIIEEPDAPYYTMPYLDGSTLQQIIDEACDRESKRLPPEFRSSVTFLVPIFLKVCKAIAYVHSQGFFHRDLKLSNIMVGSHGETHLLDWGLIFDTDHEPENKTIDGTVIYLAPELLSGSPPSFRTEIYALGLILYQILTLRFPFHGGDAAAYYKNLETEALISPVKVAPFRNIPSILSDISMKCLAADPEKRYQSVKEIISEIESHLHEAKPESVPPKSSKVPQGGTSATILGEVIASSYPSTINLKTAVQDDKVMPDFDTDEKLEVQRYRELLKRYFHHPLLEKVKTHLFACFTGIAQEPRERYYQLALLIAQYFHSESLPEAVAQRLNALNLQLSPSYFVDPGKFADWTSELQYRALSIHLAFLLSCPEAIAEIYDEIIENAPSPLPIIGQCIFALIQLGEWELAQQKIDTILQQFLGVQAIALLLWLQEALSVCQGGSLKATFLSELPKRITPEQLLPLWLILDEALRRKETAWIIQTVEQLIDEHELSMPLLKKLDSYVIWSYLIDRNWNGAEKILEFYSTRNEMDETLQFLYQCWHYATKKTLFSLEKIDKDMLPWEKRKIYNKNQLFADISSSIDK